MKRSKHLLVALGLASIFACESTPEKGTEITEVEKVETDSTECLAPAEWFTMVNGTRKTPAPKEGKDSPFANNETVSNCDFHQWSWQKFLWLTNQESNGKPLFMNTMKQVSPMGQIISGTRGIVLTDSESAQASSPNDILKTPKFTPSDQSSTVYYSIFVNDALYNTILKYAPRAKADPASIKDVTYPVGSLELKTSWLNAAALGADSSNYFVTDGIINSAPARVALLGMHVVGIVENHPEFVWATFEHQNLAPAYDWSQATPTTDAPVTSTTNYPLFSKSATSSITNIQTYPNNTGTDIFSLYKYGVPVYKETEGKFNVQKFMESSQNGSQNFNNIRTINESVKSQLTDVWNNYFYNGSIWINTEGYVGIEAQATLIDTLSYNISNIQPGALARGSVAAYNITMETFVQAGFSKTGQIHQLKIGDLANCFSCHNSTHNNNESPLQLSHVFNGYLGNLKGLSREQVKRIHVDGMFAQAKLRQSKK